MKALLVLMFVLCTSNIFALDGANTLWQSAPGNKSTEAKETAASLRPSQRPQDPFLSQIYTAWKTGEKLPYDVNLWMETVVSGDFEKAAHLWSAIKQKLPGHFESQGEIIYAYLLHRLELNHLFFEQYFKLKKRYQNQKAPAELVLLDESIQAGQLVSDLKPYLSVEQGQFLSSLKGVQNNVLTDARAWAAYVNKQVKDEELSSLPKGHPLLLPLARLKTLELARKGDLRGAGQILKEVVEPEITRLGNAEALAQHHLTLARLLYQAQVLPASIDYYQSIPNGSASFLTARSEMMWALLRQGNLPLLRGELRTLSDKALVDHFMPEVYLVRAISNLKLCLYESVEKDIKTFVEQNQSWAKKIEDALKSGNPEVPVNATPSVTLFTEVKEGLTKEITKLENLGQKSIQAAIPAVGIQPHWENGSKRLQAALFEVNKRLLQEKNNWWLARRHTLVNAIRKMQFVRIEFLSEVHRLGSQKMAEGTLGDQVSTKLAATETAGKIVFPFDGVFWPDEYFHLRSSAQNACLSYIKEK